MNFPQIDSTGQKNKWNKIPPSVGKGWYGGGRSGDNADKDWGN